LGGADFGGAEFSPQVGKQTHPKRDPFPFQLARSLGMTVETEARAHVRNLPVTHGSGQRSLELALGEGHDSNGRSSVT